MTGLAEQSEAEARSNGVARARVRAVWGGVSAPQSRTGRASGGCGSGKGQTRREPAVDQEPDGEGDARTTPAVNSCDQRQRRGQPADCAYVPLLAQSHYSAPQPQTAPRALLSPLPPAACVGAGAWYFLGVSCARVRLFGCAYARPRTCTRAHAVRVRLRIHARSRIGHGSMHARRQLLCGLLRRVVQRVSRKLSKLCR